MNKQTVPLKKLLSQIVMLVLVVGCAAQTAVTEEAVAVSLPVSTTGTAEALSPAAEPIAPATDEASCAAPRPEDVARCREMEAEILAATVRLDFRIYAPDQDGVYAYEDGSIGHATIIEGRYLLTHNHFGLSLADFQDGRRRTLTVYRSDGEVLLKDAPFGAFDVVAVAANMLLFDFGDYGGEGLFAALGLGSATIDPQAAAQVRPGMTVAQVDWDGGSAHVDWVRIQAIREEEGTRVVELGNFVQQGASGGGIFYNGYHLANNWFRRTDRTEDGEVVQQYTVAALNQSADLVVVAAMDSGARPDASADIGQGERPTAEEGISQSM